MCLIDIFLHSFPSVTTLVPLPIDCIFILHIFGHKCTPAFWQSCNELLSCYVIITKSRLSYEVFGVLLSSTKDRGTLGFVKPNRDVFFIFFRFLFRIFFGFLNFRKLNVFASIIFLWQLIIRIISRIFIFFISNKVKDAFASRT